MSARPKIKEVREAIKATRRVVGWEELKAAFEASPLGELQCICLDSEYVALPLETWRLVLQWSRVDKFRYKADKRDCDNFAAALHGTVPIRFKVNTAAYVLDFSGKHAYTALAVAEPDGGLSIAVVEPQTDALVSVGSEKSDHEAYTATKGFVLWG